MIDDEASIAFDMLESLQEYKDEKDDTKSSLFEYELDPLVPRIISWERFILDTNMKSFFTDYGTGYMSHVKELPLSSVIPENIIDKLTQLPSLRHGELEKKRILYRNCPYTIYKIIYSSAVRAIDVNMASVRYLYFIDDNKGTHQFTINPNISYPDIQSIVVNFPEIANDLDEDITHSQEIMRNQLFLIFGDKISTEPDRYFISEEALEFINTMLLLDELFNIYPMTTYTY